ncbi:MAG: hypothetical protein J6T60_10240 [Bacteroidales bacterium]|nr:hypothetical protein [Bacteroidales bacterium]
MKTVKIIITVILAVVGIVLFCFNQTCLGIVAFCFASAIWLAGTNNGSGSSSGGSGLSSSEQVLLLGD